MNDLVTLAAAKAHLRRDADDTASNEDISQKLAAATEIVVAYCDPRSPPWTDETVPARVKSAILLVLGNLFGDRGDGVGSSAAAGPITDRVEDLLYGLRTPVLA